MTTPNLRLPEIAESQASKYLTHNDALRILDALCPSLVVQDTLSTPPGSPTNGQCWIIGPAATGAWAGHETDIAQRYSGAWYFITPLEGWAAWDIDAAAQVRFDGAAWA